MESLLLPAWNLILFLIELAIILLLIDGIMSIICSMFGLSWKKVLMWAAAVFGLLWLRDFIKNRNERKPVTNEEIVTEATDTNECEIIED